MPDNCIYVGRPTRYANPFTVEEYGRDLAVELFRDIAQGIWTPTRLAHLADDAYARAYTAQATWKTRIGGHPLEAIRTDLSGRNLACWCPLADPTGQPVPCHAEVLLELANPARPDILREVP